MRNSWRGNLPVFVKRSPAAGDQNKRCKKSKAYAVTTPAAQVVEKTFKRKQTHRGGAEHEKNSQNENRKVLTINLYPS